jgi:hypothetical protein
MTDLTCRWVFSFHSPRAAFSSIIFSVSCVIEVLSVGGPGAASGGTAQATRRPAPQPVRLTRCASPPRGRSIRTDRRIDRSNSSIEIMHDEQTKRINLEAFAAIRSATTITIREARGLPANVRLDVELTDHRHTWAALLLVARRNANARIYVDPALARSAEELIDVARQSMPAALPHQRTMKPDPDAEIGKMLLPKGENGLEPEDFPEPRSPVRTPPRPIHFEETLRSAIASNFYAREGYALLYHHVGPHNRDRGPNAERILGLCTSDLTATLVRFLAKLEPQQVREELDYYDMPPELPEHDPARWPLIEIQKTKVDLQTMATAGSSWGLRPPLPPTPETTFDV